jgi:hypothetical protein
MRRWMPAAAVVGALVAVSPAAAQQAPSEWTALPHPTDTGKPPIFDPQFARKADEDLASGCAPGLQCRFRLLGVIQNNGAVELQATAFSW